MVYLLFFLSGISGLIYQVIWVRAFGNAFGNTIHSSALVIAIFMLGLGAGSYALGRWADRRYAHAPHSLLRTYGTVELTVAALAALVSLVLPKLAAIAAAVSAYHLDAQGWYELSPMSYLARGAIAVVMLTPITVLMGGTLTLLIRHLVRRRPEAAATTTIAWLYAVNTAGAAAGAFLTDFVLVRELGLFATQMVAVALNVVAGGGAIALSVYSGAGRAPTDREVTDNVTGVRDRQVRDAVRSVVPLTAAAIALSGFASMGMEIVWLRHVSLLLGGFRAVFSLLLTIILAGVGAGALIGAMVERRFRRPALLLIAVQALFVLATLAGLGGASMPALAAAQQTLDAMLPTLSPAARWWAELWYNARPILAETLLPSLIIGCSFPVGNALVQHAAETVGRRAGALYFANTAGAVSGSLVAGFILLPLLGMQAATTMLVGGAAAAIVPLLLMLPRKDRLPAAGAAAAVALGIGLWTALPGDYLLGRAMAPQAEGEQLVTRHEGINEVLAVTEIAGRGRGLITNGHAMSSTAPLDQRYMRALAHVPLLSMDHPARALVIGFGVGNTTHAATLYPSMTRIDVADLSKNILDHAEYFRDANRGVLRDPRVHVYVNDGRLHLHMQPEGSYDLITLEPPPIAHAGVAALYSREFYALARSRLAPGGYLSQWLPAYQVPAETTLAMVRAFIDVFPQAVLLSGTQAELLLVGTTAPSIEIDPERVAARLAALPDVRADASRLDLGTPTEIVGTFVGSAATLARATREVAAVSDDRPLQEYGVASVIGSGLRGVPASLFELTAVNEWCPKCVDQGRPAPAVTGLDTYLALLDEAYHASPAAMAAARRGSGPRPILGSAYLGAMVPDTYRANRLVASALAEQGSADDALPYLQRAVEIDPAQADAQYELGRLLLERGSYSGAADHLRAALRDMADSSAAHNDLGVALASSGSIDEAIDQFRAAVSLEPGFAEARRNLAAALQARRQD